MHSIISVDSSFEEDFCFLADRWFNETAYISAPNQRYLHDAHLNIIGMGRRVVPLILQRLLSKPDDWFFALAALTQENPIKDEDIGDFDAMKNAWLAWGTEKKLIMSNGAPKAS